MNFDEMTVEQIREEHCSKYRSNPIDTCVGCEFFGFVGMTRKCTLLVYDLMTDTVVKRKTKWRHK